MSDRRVLLGVSLNVLRHIADTANALFLDGTGRALDAIADENDMNVGNEVGFIDELNPETDIYYWANELLRFVRFVHSIVREELNNVE
jgi:hypothetical protein